MISFRDLFSCATDGASSSSSSAFKRPVPPPHAHRLKSSFLPPPTTLVIRDSVCEFIDTALRFPESQALQQIKRDIAADLRSKGIRTMKSLVFAPESLIASVVPNVQYQLRLLSAMKEAKQLYPEWFVLEPPPEVLERSSGCRISRVMVHMGRFAVMKLTVTWTYLSVTDGRFYRHEISRKSTPTMGFAAALGREETSVQAMNLAQDEYLTSIKMKMGIEGRLLGGMELVSNRGRKLKCVGETPRDMMKDFEYKVPLGSSSVYGIVGFEVGFRRMELSSGISNLVVLCSALNESPHLAYLPEESELPLSFEQPFHVEEVAFALQGNTAVWRPGVVNGVTGELEEEEEGSSSEEEEKEPQGGDENRPPVPPPRAAKGADSIASLSFRANFLTGPISYATFSSPVTLCDGHTYEMNYITRWLADHKTSPMTGNVLISTKMKGNVIVKKLLEDGGGGDCQRTRVKELLTCPLSKRLFKEPVLFFGDGMTYERAELEKYLDAQTGVGKLLTFQSVKSPSTGAKVSDVSFVQNFVVKSLMEIGRGVEVEMALLEEEEEEEVWKEVRVGEKRERSRTHSFDEMWPAFFKVGVFVHR